MWMLLYEFLVLFCTCAQGVRKGSSLLQLTKSSQRLREPEQNQVRVAVVGSGPISEADRILIRGAQEIYRFNSMNNLRKDETVGTVFLRRGHNERDILHGLPPFNGACPLINHADAMLIIMDPGAGLTPERLQHLRANWSSVEVVEESPSGTLEIDGSRVSPNTAGWSSGFVGIAHVLKHSTLVKQGHKVHVFGMNWNSTSVHSGGHPWVKEEEVLEHAKSVVVHATTSHDYKPLTANGTTMMTCEGAYAFYLQNNSHESDANSSEHEIHRPFGLESKEDGSFVFVSHNAPHREYLVGDGSLSRDKAKGVSVGIADITASRGSFLLQLGEETYTMHRRSI